MKQIQRAVSLLLLLLLLLPAGFTKAEQEAGEASAPEESEKAVATIEDPVEDTQVRPMVSLDEALYRQVQDTYKAAKKRSRRRSFKGYCGAYVANQLVVLGINRSYLSANGKNTYDIYRKLDRTTGGYGVTCYSASKYTLMEALTDILQKDPSATNILVGFQKGVSKSGKKYGHVLFIHGVRNGKIYYSDSSARTVDDVTYKEGEPIVCSLTAFVEQYAKYKLDGVVHFWKAEAENQSPITEDTAVGSSENVEMLG